METRQVQQVDAQQAAQTCSGGVCFTAGTLIHTIHGTKPIETIERGELVWSREEFGDKYDYRAVIATKVTPNAPIYEVKIEHDNGLEETIKTTEEHPFWIDGEGWRKASVLEAGMKLLDKYGKATAAVVSQTALDSNETVYNFEVQDFSTYHIGEMGIWVHNAQCCEIDERTQKSVNKTISEASSGKINYTRSYHGRLGSSLEKDIISKPDSVFLATNGNLIFLKDGNIVVTAGNGSNRGKLITSYGKDGQRGESGKAIFGGKAEDPGISVTEEMIIKGKIPRPDGSNLPPATKIK